MATYPNHQQRTTTVSLKIKNKFMANNYYKTLSNQSIIAQLQQLTHLTWDGDLISKMDRKKLTENGLVQQFDGWNLITPKGVKYLQDLGFINP